MPRVRYKHNPQPTRDEMKIMIKQQLQQVTMLLNQLGEAYRHINDLEELLQKKKKKEEDEVMNGLFEKKEEEEEKKEKEEKEGIPMRHLFRVENIDRWGSNWPLGAKMCFFDPKIWIFGAKSQFFV